MLDRVDGDFFAAREHVFDQVDTAARTVELVAKQHIGRAGCGAKPAMSAGPQHFLRRRGIRIGELLWREVGSHLINSPRPYVRG